MGALTRRQLSAVIIVLVLIRGLELGASLVWIRWMDREQYISQRRFEAALWTTYHAPDRGKPETLSFTDLGEHHTFIVQQWKCVPLAAPTSLSHVMGAGMWSGVVGDQAQWVIIVTVRFSSAADARRALLSKRVALVRCPSIRATFPPFDQVSEIYRVSDIPRYGRCGGTESDTRSPARTVTSSMCANSAIP